MGCEALAGLHLGLDAQCSAAVPRQSAATRAAIPAKPVSELQVQNTSCSGLSRASLRHVAQVNIANQIYDFMDNHINQLDTDLQQLDGEIEADRKELGLEGDETACEKLGIEAPQVCWQIGAIGLRMSGQNLATTPGHKALWATKTAKS